MLFSLLGLWVILEVCIEGGGGWEMVGGDKDIRENVLEILLVSYSTISDIIYMLVMLV